MKKIIILFLVVWIGTLAVAQESDYSQITNQTCDALNNCSEELECYYFPDIGLRCAEPNPCEYYNCEEGYNCNLAESYPSKIICNLIPKEDNEDNICEDLTEEECISNENCEPKYTQCSGNNCDNGQRYQNCQKTQSQSQQNQGLGQVIRQRVKAGVYTSPEGEQIRIREMAQNRLLLEVDGVEVDCNCDLNQETVQNKTRLKLSLSNGRKAEIKIMPRTASERAIQRLGELNFTTELKEVGKGEEVQAVYRMKAKKQGKFLGLFKIKGEVQTDVDVETGEIISSKKPWWSFLASGI